MTMSGHLVLSFGEDKDNLKETRGNGPCCNSKPGAGVVGYECPLCPIKEEGILSS